jgi:hypothetical protein
MADAAIITVAVGCAFAPATDVGSPPGRATLGGAGAFGEGKPYKLYKPFLQSSKIMASTTRKSAAKAPIKTPVAAPAAVPPAAETPAGSAQPEAAAKPTGTKPAPARRPKAAPSAPVDKPAKTAGKKSGVTRPAKAPKAATVAKVLKALKQPKAAKNAKPVKEDKVKKAKLVRDSFTIPKSEYMVLEQLKQRAAQLGAPIKKSELLRAGIKALAAMDNVDYLTALAAVPAIKTGRPAKS